MSYIIISLKHGSAQEPVFWRANDAGYTSIPWAAGIYSAEQVHNNPEYYNNGYSTIAVPLTEQALASIGFKCQYDQKLLFGFFKAGRKIKSSK